MIKHGANTYRLYPTPEQDREMRKIAGACRFVYNLALEQRRDWYKPGRRFSTASQCRELTKLRYEVDWLSSAPAQCLQQALRDLDRAFARFANKRHDNNHLRNEKRVPKPRRDGMPLGYPSPRRKGIHESFRFPEPSRLKLIRTGKSSGL